VGVVIAWRAFGRLSADADTDMSLMGPGYQFASIASAVPISRLCPFHQIFTNAYWRDSGQTETPRRRQLEIALPG